MLAVEYSDSPIGLLRIVAEGACLKRLDFVHEREEESSPSVYTNEVANQLTEYFAGTRQRFELKLSPDGTEFQQQVWARLREIPYAELISYKDLAIMLGDVNKIRAVGTANGANPIPVIIPCHRVIGSNHKLVGYSGGLHIKRWLINHENAGLKGSLFGRIED